MLLPESLSTNWCSLNEIQEDEYCFDEDQRHLFDLLRIKKEHFGERFEKGNYFENASALVAANSRYAERVVYCGNKNRWNGTGSCQKWRLCSRCAFARRQKALQMYLSGFASNRFLAGTVSFDGCLTPKDWLQLSWIVVYWDAIKSAIYHEYNEDRILGAYFTEELCLGGLLPLRVRPHTHSMFHVESNDGSAADRLSTNLSIGVQNAVHASGYELALTPSIVVSRISSEKDFANCLQYETKAIEIAEPYEIAISDGADNSIKEVNRELAWFFDAWMGTVQNRPAIRRIGTMHHASKNFVGNLWSKQRRIEFVRSYYDERKREREAPVELR